MDSKVPTINKFINWCRMDLTPSDYVFARNYFDAKDSGERVPDCWCWTEADNRQALIMQISEFERISS